MVVVVLGDIKPAAGSLKRNLTKRIFGPPAESFPHTGSVWGAQSGLYRSLKVLTLP